MADKNLPTIDLVPEERALLLNDLSKLSADQRSNLYIKVCQSLGLNHLTQPFNYIQLNGKLTFYAQRNCTDQLRSIHQVSVIIQSRTKQEDLYIVCARAKLPNGREDESIGSVFIGGLKGEALSNAIMKAETKAKRRVTLSICGLSFLDGTEVETIKDAKIINPDDELPALAIAEPPVPAPQPTEKKDQDTEDLDAIFGPQDAPSNAPKEPPVEDFVACFGMFQGMRLGDCNKDHLLKYVRYKENNLPAVRNSMLEEFLNNACKFLKVDRM